MHVSTYFTPTKSAPMWDWFVFESEQGKVRHATQTNVSLHTPRSTKFSVHLARVSSSTNNFVPLFFPLRALCVHALASRFVHTSELLHRQVVPVLSRSVRCVFVRFRFTPHGHRAQARKASVLEQA